jgi:hypothetical protein
MELAQLPTLQVQEVIKKCLDDWTWFSVAMVTDEVYRQIPSLVHYKGLLEPAGFNFDVIINGYVRTPLQQRYMGHRYFIHDGCEDEENYLWCHREDATPDELDRYGDWLIARGAKMREEGKWFKNLARTRRKAA